MSGIVFAGCSHTHGHGLWFYCKDIYGQYKGNPDNTPIIKDRQIHHLKYTLDDYLLICKKCHYKRHNKIERLPQ